MLFTKVFTDAGYDALGVAPVYVGMAIENVELSYNSGKSAQASMFSVCKSINKSVQSSCEAEYYGLIFALGQLQSMEIRYIHILNDNQTMVRQMQGRYRIHKAYLQELKDLADAMWATLVKEGRFIKISFTPRKYNIADKCVQEAKADYERSL
jgi:ribonuclease HI